jgi:hypothetical protein
LNRVGLVVLLSAVACATPRKTAVDRREPAAPAQSQLLPLDDAHAAELRRAFDEAKDRPRYIVALSPT